MRNNDVPLQLELHPGAHCGPLDCIFCYGKSQTLCDGSLSIGDYSSLLDDLMEYPPFIEISGIRSDPLSYPKFAELIHLIKEKQLNFGVHTKAYFLNSEVAKELTKSPSDGSYITISVNSHLTNIYNKLHGLDSNSDAHEKLKKNLENLYNEKIKHNSKLRINLAYLLMADNSSREDISQFIEEFEEYADVLRFSLPQVPNIAQPVGFLTPREKEATFEMLQNWDNGKITMLNFQESDHTQNFKYCWAQRFNATIDKAGNVFPCPQVALKDYEHLIWGNIKEKSFWDIWNSTNRLKMQNLSVDCMKCRVCDRKDENINVVFEELMDSNKHILNVQKDFDN